MRSSRRITWRPAPGSRSSRAGGSAVDAAIATNAVLAVVDGDRLRHRRRRVLADLGCAAAAASWRSTAPARSSIRQPTPRRSARGACERLPLRGGLSITVPGAVRSWGDAHDRFGRLSRAEILRPGDRAGRGRLPGLGRLHRRGRAERRAVRRGARPRRAWFAVYRPHGRAWQPGERVRLPALGGDPDQDRRRRLGRVLRRRDRRRTRPARWPTAGSAIGLDDLAAHTLDLDRADRDRLPRRPGHEPPTEQLGLRRPRDPERPRAVRATAGRGLRRRRRCRSALDPPRDRGVEAGDGRSRRPPDRPGDLPRRRSTDCSTRATPPSSRRGSIPPEPRRPRGRHGPARRRDGLARRGRCARATPSA